MNFLKRLGPALVLVVLGLAPVLAACSSDDGDGDSANANTPAPSKEEYCDAIRELRDEWAPYLGSTLPDETVTRLQELVVRAARVAPSDVRGDFTRSLLGDSYARDNVDAYNQRECNVDTSSLGRPGGS